MKRSRSLRFAPILVLVLTTSAHALTTLVTPEVDAGTQDVVFCRVVNEGQKAVTVRTEIVLNNNADVNDFTEPVAPGQSESLTVAGPVSARCRFSGSFSRRTVRGSIDLKTDVRTILVAPAQ
jgi:hypothetical protein